MGMKILKLGMEIGPPCVLESKGRGVYILTELEFLADFFVILAALAFIVWILSKG